jgi:hypothetical protein
MEKGKANKDKYGEKWWEKGRINKWNGIEREKSVEAGETWKKEIG